MKEPDEFGNKVKEIEQMEAGRKFLANLPVCVRIDGKSFHTYTKKLKRPYDERLVNCFVETTKFLVDQIQGCVIGYTQSDEISLILYQEDIESEIYFDGKI